MYASKLAASWFSDFTCYFYTVLLLLAFLCFFSSFYAALPVIKFIKVFVCILYKVVQICLCHIHAIMKVGRHFKLVALLLFLWFFVVQTIVIVDAATKSSKYCHNNATTTTTQAWYALKHNNNNKSNNNNESNNCKVKVTNAFMKGFGEQCRFAWHGRRAAK